jgi:hypothetical protein
MLGRWPISRVELAPSYRASQVRPASCGTMRGAAAPTAGSAKCGSSASSQPGAGTQSESRNATSGVRAAARPVFLAAAGPPLTGRGTTRAPAAAAARRTAAGSRDPSSTTMIGVGPAGPAPISPFPAGPGLVSPARHRASSAARSRTGTTTVTSPGPGPPGASSSAGWAIPVSSSRRASARAFWLSGTGFPENQLCTSRTPAGLSRSTRAGEPPASTVPPASMRAPGSGRRRNPAGTSSLLGPGPAGSTPPGRRGLVSSGTRPG